MYLRQYQYSSISPALSVEIITAQDRRIIVVLVLNVGWIHFQRFDDFNPLFLTITGLLGQQHHGNEVKSSIIFDHVKLVKLTTNELYC